jgi:hypothetical protein
MKKNTLLLVGVAGAAAYFLLAKKSKGESKIESAEIANDVQEETGEEVSAVIKTPAGQIQQGIEQAKQIAETVKSGVVAIKDITTGTTAIVRAKKKGERAETRKAKLAARKAKLEQRKAQRAINKGKRKAATAKRKAVRKARKKARTQPGEFQRVPVRN